MDHHGHPTFDIMFFKTIEAVVASAFQQVGEPGDPQESLTCCDAPCSNSGAGPMTKRRRRNGPKQGHPRLTQGHECAIGNSAADNIWTEQ